MGKCAKCGKRGLFLSVNTLGLCKDCQLAEDIRQREDARKAYVKSQEDAFLKELASLKSVPVEANGQKKTLRKASEIDEIKLSNITSRSDRNKLGQFVVIDTETTGTKVSSHIVEVSAIRFQSFLPTEIFTTLVKSPIPIPPDATEVNQITDDMLNDAPEIWEIIPSLQSFVGNSNLVGHNIFFDLRLLYRHGFDIQPKQKLFDTLDLIGRTLKKPKGKWSYDEQEYIVDYDSDYDVLDYRLETLCKYYNIAFVGAHRSAADCLATGKLFLSIIDDKM